MKARQTLAAVAKFALVAAASAAAASLWAQGRPETGLLLDAQTWREEVVTASTGPWPDQGWFRLVPQDRAVSYQKCFSARSNFSRGHCGSVGSIWGELPIRQAK